MSNNIVTKTNRGIIILMTLLIIVICIFSIFTFKFNNGIRQLHKTVVENNAEYVEKLQNISAIVDYKSKRKFMVTKSRDFILEKNSSLSVEDAYDIAELNFDICERYNQDPRLVLALQYQESRYNSNAISSAGAKGICQIWPPTGRLLANGLGIEYSDDILHDNRVNILMCVYYLDNLFAVYNDTKLVLAEYNGGPKNAYFIRIGSSSVSSETRDYVKRVMKLYDDIKTMFMNT